jgi:hypothetical protein
MKADVSTRTARLKPIVGSNGEPELMLRRTVRARLAGAAAKNRPARTSTIFAMRASWSG